MFIFRSSCAHMILWMKRGARITSVLFDVVPLTDCNIVSYFLAFPFKCTVCVNPVCLCGDSKSDPTVARRTHRNGITYVCVHRHSRAFTLTHSQTKTLARSPVRIHPSMNTYGYNIIAIIDDGDVEWRTTDACVQMRCRAIYACIVLLSISSVRILFFHSVRFAITFYYYLSDAFPKRS